MQQTSLTVLAKAAAQAHELPAAIILAVIQVESAGNGWAARFEPAYRWCWNVRTGHPFSVSPSHARHSSAPSGFAAPDPQAAGYYSNATSEWIGQKTSWGVMQIMGAVAREHGHTGPLPQLCDPAHGIDYGCRHLARLRDRFIARHGWAGVLDAYNDGSARIERHPDYPDKVAAVSPAAQALIYPNGAQ